MRIRVGQGFDVHAFGPGDHVRLGGVDIPHTHGLVAHSDGDVIIHALCDALLGAAGLDDIGAHFPDTDPQWKDADSRALLRECVAKLAAHGFVPSNADVTLIAQAPRVAPYIDTMREHLAADLGVEAGAVSVKATTTEKLGAIGRGEGIAATAVVLITDA